MAQPSVKTVQFVDPRIEPQPDPVYSYVIGPTQNQYYKIPASGLSNSSITFNNLTTLGVDRAYLDTFEIELTAVFQFKLADQTGDTAHPLATALGLFPDSWTFQSFPFNSCCEEARVNINGGAFFSQPLSYIRAKERYMNQKALSSAYQNVCPVQKPQLQYESGRHYDAEYGVNKWKTYFGYPSVNATMKTISSESCVGSISTASARNPPTRYGIGSGISYMRSEAGENTNMDIVVLGTEIKNASNQVIGYANFRRGDSSEKEFNDPDSVYVTVTWREPLFVSPFSSRYDATYGRPLYNITSMDFSFTLMNLGNMIRVANFHNGFAHSDTITNSTAYIKEYSVNIKAAQLCYQVMTIPTNVHKPIATLVPYRRFVPYITELPAKHTNRTDYELVKEVASGVYTMNEIPTAIWIFCAPVKKRYQENVLDEYAVAQHGLNGESTDNTLLRGNWDSNKLFAGIRGVNISLSNTTQILNTAELPDLYRIAKANGCEDSYRSWACIPSMSTAGNATKTMSGSNQVLPIPTYDGVGSVLRLKPGVDIILPQQPLIPGANANNMVLQVKADFVIPPHSSAQDEYALWLLFEYVGVASITPGQCEISMNPLGSGDIVSVSPIMSATSNYTEGALEGAGFWDSIRKAARIAAQLGNNGVLSRILKAIPGAKNAASWAESHGLGEMGMKRPRYEGGAVMGKGLKDWM